MILGSNVLFESFGGPQSFSHICLRILDLPTQDASHLPRIIWQGVGPTLNLYFPTVTGWGVDPIHFILVVLLLHSFYTSVVLTWPHKMIVNGG